MDGIAFTIASSAAARTRDGHGCGRGGANRVSRARRSASVTRSGDESWVLIAEERRASRTAPGGLVRAVSGRVRRRRLPISQGCREGRRR